MEDRELTEDEDATAQDRELTEDEDVTTTEEHKFFGVIPQKVVLVAVVVLPILGFLVGMIGTGKDSPTVPVDLVISPERAGGALQPGATDQFTVLVENPSENGARVTSISAGSSEATAGGCPAGTVTSEPVDDPPGYIGPTSVLAYRVTATMAADAGDQCTGQSFTLPLTVELVTAG